MIRRTSRILYSFCSAIKIPEMEEGDKLSFVGKYAAASSVYQRLIQIINSAKIYETNKDYYSEAISKLAASQYLTGKNKDVNKLLGSIQDKNIENRYKNYLVFLNYSNLKKLASSQNKCSIKLNNQNDQKALKQIVDNLLSDKDKLNSNAQTSFPFLSYISRNLNNQTDYRKVLVNLIDRSQKSQKSEIVNEQISRIQKQQISPQTQLLFYLSKTLQAKPLKSADTQFINTKTNSILQSYQKSHQKQVYKPLLNIILSLIAQKHYMSAQGMVGHIKSSEMQLISGYASEDKNLVNAVYRMLVTRANNQGFEEGWAREEPVRFGGLVVERIVKAVLLGHQVDRLIC